MQQLDIAVEPIIESAAQDEPSELAIEVLAELAGRQHPVATNLIANPKQHPEVSLGMLDYLRDFHDWTRTNLNADAVGMLAEHMHAKDNLVYDVDIVPEFWDPWREKVPLVEQACIDAAAKAAANAALAPQPLEDLHLLTTDELLAGFEFSSMGRLLAELKQRNSDQDRALLEDAVLNRTAAAGIRGAARALGEMGDMRLLAMAEEAFGWPDRLEDKPLPPTQRTRRAAMLWYVTMLPAAATLPLAREWWQRGKYFRVVAGRILSQHAEGQDRTWLEDYLRRVLPHGTGEHWISEIDALTHIGDQASVPLLTEIAERATYTWARIRALHGLAVILGRCTAIDEALWDCEDSARGIGCKHATWNPPTRRRLEELAAAPFEDSAVRKLAAQRLQSNDS